MPINQPHADRAKARRVVPVIASCEACGAPAEDRHHRNGDTADNRPENLAPLCRACHAALHIDTIRANAVKARAASAASRRARTHCKHGHEWTPENTYVYPRGVRECRVCKREASRRHKEGRRA